MRFAKLFASWRGNTTLTSIPETNRRKKSSKLFPKPTIFSAMRRSGKFTISLGFIRTILILPLRKHMRTQEPAAQVAIPADFPEDRRVAGRECPSTSAALISPIWEADKAAGAEGAEVSATFFPGFLGAMAAGPQLKRALSRGAIWNIR